MHKRIVALSFSLLIAGIAAASAAQSTPSTAHEMVGLQFLVGTWHCTRTISTAGATTVATVSEIETVVPRGTQWLHGSDTISYNGQMVGTEDDYIGYNARHGRWVLVSIDSHGNSQVETNPSSALNGTTWTVAYPSRANAMAVFRENSSRQYTSDSSWTSSHSGKTIKSHEVCTKQ